MSEIEKYITNKLANLSEPLKEETKVSKGKKKPGIQNIFLNCFKKGFTITLFVKGTKLPSL